jgi:hypothetical protein
LVSTVVRRFREPNGVFGAQRRVYGSKGFYIHATAFVLVNIALFALNVLVGGAWWFYRPLLGWGMGLGIHALGVFGFGGSGPWGQEWEARKTRVSTVRTASSATHEVSLLSA